MRYLLALLIVALPLAAQAEYGDAIVSEVTSIYDGDTFRMNIEDWPAIIGERVSIRLRGADTLRGYHQIVRLLAMMDEKKE